MSYLFITYLVSIQNGFGKFEREMRERRKRDEEKKYNSINRPKWNRLPFHNGYFHRKQRSIHFYYRNTPTYVADCLKRNAFCNRNGSVQRQRHSSSREREKRRHRRTKKIETRNAKMWTYLCVAHDNNHSVFFVRLLILCNHFFWERLHRSLRRHHSHRTPFI